MTYYAINTITLPAVNNSHNSYFNTSSFDIQRNENHHLKHSYASLRSKDSNRPGGVIATLSVDGMRTR